MRNKIISGKGFKLVLAFVLAIVYVGIRHHLASLRDADPIETAKKQIQRREFDSAIETLSPILRDSPPNNSARLLLAEAYAAKHWLTEATQQYELVIANDQKQAEETLIDLGMMLLANQHYDGAFEAFSKAIAQNPNSANANYLSALALIKKGKKTDARPYLLRAIELDPANKPKYSVWINSK